MVCNQDQDVDRALITTDFCAAIGSLTEVFLSKHNVTESFLLENNFVRKMIAMQFCPERTILGHEDQFNVSS